MSISCLVTATAATYQDSSSLRSWLGPSVPRSVGKTGHRNDAEVAGPGELHDTMRRKTTGACRSPAYYSHARLTIAEAAAS
jgi:hypothetical protein